ncbi:glycosyltransferase [Microbacterium enclense]|uniref:Glycosyltransferase n=1 Tax=Microbacterium enclense TaxID=993073 RepID=A0A3S3KYB6_9MICO|nr:glycosyltransferase family 4 protein [Microbacterium enclense]RWR19187.1 glycosyltransferase [Microbacterium enclense]
MTLRPVFVDHTSERGGAELALRRLLLADVDWRPTLVCPPSPTTDAYADLPPTVAVERRGPVHRARAASGPAALGALRLAWGMVRSLASVLTSPAIRRADVLIANTSRSSVYVAAAGVLTRTPVVVHIRDLVEPEAIGGLATALLRRFVLPRAAGVVANSHASLATVAPHVGPRCQTAVIASPSGIARRADPVVRDTVESIGLVARIDPWKGQELLLRAFAQAFPTAPTRLVFYGATAFGTEEYLEQLQALATESGVADRVVFAGHVDDVAGAIDGLDVCVQCSIRPEPLGQNVLQYLAAGKPTVVADEGGPVEWVTDGENGLTFRARDVDSLASCLRRLAEEPDLRARLARAAAATAGLETDSEVAARMRAFLTRVVDTTA